MNEGNGDERLGRLAEEIERLLAAGEAPDPAALARAFEVDEEDAADLIASLTAVGDALFSDLEPVETWPELPDDYEIVEEIGRGGMGIVYRAEQKSLGRAVAVKVIRPGALGLGDSVKRFRKEARSLARLRHPGIVSVHDVGTAGDAIYFTMDWIEGGSLADRLRHGRLNAGEAARILAQVASAIAHTHERGIVHRDLKPANVLLDRDGNAWVVDFGLALDGGLSVDATGTGRILGTPAYMSPEQARGDGTAGEATDVYALGVLLYECLTGVTPFTGRPIGDVLRAVQSEEPPAPSRLDPRIPRDLETIVLTAMAKEPARRYATARAMMEDLRAFAEGAPIRAKRPGIVRGVGRFARRHRAPLLAGGLTSFAFALLLVFGLLPRLGLTAEELVTTADQLRADGEDAAALTLYEEARAKLGDAGGELDAKIAVAGAFVRGRLARRRMFDGDVEGAAAEIEAAVAETDAAIGADQWNPAPLLWDLYRAKVASGDGKAAGEMYRSIDRRVRDYVQERENQDLRRGIDRERFDIFVVGPQELFELAVTTRKDPAPWGRISAGSLLPPQAVMPQTRARIAEYLFSTGSEGVGVWLELVRADATWPHPHESSVREPAILEIGRALRKHRGGEVTLALTDLAADESAPREARAFALHLVAKIEVWPTVPRLNYRRHYAVWADGKSTALLTAIRDSEGLSREDLLRAKIDQGLAVENAQFVRRHTGRFDHDFEDVRAWWAEGREEDPRAWLAGSVGLPPESSRDVEALLAHLAKTRDEERFRTHLLLTLAAPADVTPPVLPIDGREPEQGIVAAWRRALNAETDHAPRLLRVAFFECRDAEPPTILWQENRPIRVGVPEAVEMKVETVDPWSLAWQVPGLGGPRAVAAPRRISARTGFLLADSPTGLRLSVGQFAKENVGPGGMRSTGWSSSNRQVREGMILSPDSMGSYSGSREGTVRNGFLLAVTEAAGADPRPWTVDDWRNKLVENLEFLARGKLLKPEPSRSLSDFEREYLQSLWMHPKIAAHVGLPGRADTVGKLNGVLAVSRPYEGTTWLRARLMAGDATVLKEKGVAERLPGLVGGSRDMGPPLWWSRLFLGTENPEIRDAAAGVLGDLPLSLPIALKLDRAIRANDWTVPEALAAQLEGLGWRRAKAVFMGQPVVMTGALLCASIALLSLILLALFRVRGRSLLQPAAWLVLAGLGFLSLSVFRSGVDLLSDEAGIGMVFLGTVLLTRTAGRAGRWSSIAFGVAVACTLAMRIGFGADVLRMLASLAIAVGVVGLPRLAFGLVGQKPKRHPVFLLLYAGPVLLIWVSWLLVLVTGAGHASLRGDWLLAVLACAGFAALWAIGITVTAARTRARA